MSKLSLSSFDYDLPDHLIAHFPPSHRGESRLLCVDRSEQSVRDASFQDIVSELNDQDVLVLNDTAVLSAKLVGHKKTGAKITSLLVEPESDKRVWTCLLRPSKRVKQGDEIALGEGLSFTILEKHVDGLMHRIQLSCEAHEVDLAIERFGFAPLPPYIRPDESQLGDLKQRYQTVFSNEKGSVAAPTAGLHFTQEILDQLKEKNVSIEMITLHVGYGTFKPIEVEAIEDHEMHEERYYVSEETSERLNQYRKEGRSIVAVGTTVSRTLESVWKDGEYQSGSGRTHIFIYPGYSFQGIDALITNFHLPKSSLFLLVCAFAGSDFMKRVYSHAIEQEYRFFSFGDAMLIR